MFAQRLPRIAASTPAALRWTSTTVQKRAPKAKRPAAIKQTIKVEKAPLAVPSATSSVKNNTTGARSASTASPKSSTPPPPVSNPSKVPGNPELPIETSEVFNIKIPTPEAIPEAPVEPPFVPDFWDSVKPSVPVKLTAESEQPKIVVVGGAGTHHGGGPSYNLSDVSETVSKGESTPQTSKKVEHSDSIFDDIAQDLHLPPVKEIKSNFWKLFS